MMYQVIILLSCVYVIYKFSSKLIKYKPTLFSHKKYYYASILSNLIFIVLGLLVACNLLFYIDFDAWGMVILTIGAYLQLYYFEDMVKSNKVKFNISLKLLKYAKVFTIIVILFLVFVVIQAKILTYY